jgi:hypothetical protein
MACRNPKVVLISGEKEKPGLRASPKMILPRKAFTDQVHQLKER